MKEKHCTPGALPDPSNLKSCPAIPPPKDWPALAPFDWLELNPADFSLNAESAPGAMRPPHPKKAGKHEHPKKPAPAAAFIETPKSYRDMETTITRETPLVQMTAGQLADFLKAGATAGPATIQAPAPTPGRRYVYGLKGIMQLFNVSNVTAQRYKKGIIKDAVSQYGRKIVIDADRALELFEAARAAGNVAGDQD